MDIKQEKEIKAIYKEYATVLNPLIQNYEAVGGDFPIEILNEIRSIFSHLSKCYNGKASQKKIDTNVKKARNHLKRAVLDGFKYNILAYQRNVKAFEEKYNPVLGLADNGTFVNVFWEKRLSCQESFKAAKLKESESDDVVEAYTFYEKAFNDYLEFNNLLAQKDKDLLSIKSKVESDYILKDEEYKLKEQKYIKQAKRSRIYNWVMFGLAVVSIIIGILGWTLPR